MTSLARLAEVRRVQSMTQPMAPAATNSPALTVQRVAKCSG
jgi:hypothetical protein